jgi:hypothetical protein
MVSAFTLHAVRVRLGVAVSAHEHITSGVRVDESSRNEMLSAAFGFRPRSSLMSFGGTPLPTQPCVHGF